MPAVPLPRRTAEFPLPRSLPTTVSMFDVYLVRIDRHVY
jgi:hypothetical protein